MADRDPDLSTLIDDVKTIKSILQNQDAPLPRVWIVAWTVGTAILVAGLLQYFVPFFRVLDFDGRLLWLWLPGACIAAPLGISFLHLELRRIGKSLLGQARVRHLLYARFIVPPAALLLAWMASRNPGFSIEGTILLLVAIWQVVVEQLLPESFRPVPFVYLGAGVLELGLGLTGPEVTLANVIGIAVTIGFVGWLFRARELEHERQREGGR